MNEAQKPIAKNASAGVMKPAALVTDAKQAGQRGDWALAASLFYQAYQISNRYHHAASHIGALLRAQDYQAALQACDDLQAHEESEANAQIITFKWRAVHGLKDPALGQKYLPHVPAGHVKAEKVLALYRRVTKARIPIQEEVFRKHIHATGDPYQIASFEVLCAENRGAPEAAKPHLAVLADGPVSKQASAACLKLGRLAKNQTEAAAHFLAAFKITGRPDHFALHVTAFVRSCESDPRDGVRPFQDTQDDDVLPDVTAADAHIPETIQHLYDKLRNVEPGRLSTSVLFAVFRLIARSGETIDATLLRDHFEKSGDKFEAALFDAYYAEHRDDLAAAKNSFDIVVGSPDRNLACLGRRRLARIAVLRGDRAEAAAAWDRVLQDDPNNTEAIKFCVVDAVQQGQTERAFALFKAKGSALTPAEKALLETKIRGDTVASVDILSAAIHENPLDAKLHTALIQMFLRTKDLDSVRAALDAALHHVPDDLEICRLNLQFLALMGVPIQAQLEAAKGVLDRHSDDLNLQQLVGALLARLGRRADAVRHFIAATENSSAPADLWCKAIQLLLEEGDIARAVEITALAMSRLGTTSSKGLIDSASVLLAAGKLDAAFTHVKTALEKDPNAEDACRLAGEIRFGQGRYADASQFFVKLDQHAPVKRKSFVADALARCATAAKYPIFDGDPCGPHNLFPERGFHHLAKQASVDNDPQRSGIVHVGATLSAGGAERQLSYALDAIKRTGDPSRTPQLVMRDLNPQRGLDFYLQDVLATGTEVSILKDVIASGRVRQILAEHPQYNDHVCMFAATSAEVSDVAIPLLAVLLETKPRIVHLWQDSICVAGALAAMVAGVPGIVLSLRSTIPVEVQRSRRHLREGFLSTLQYKGCVRFINNSYAGARDYEQWLGMDAGKIGVIHNGYDFDRIFQRSQETSQEKLRQDAGIPADAIVVGSVMRFAAEKRPELWIDTVSALIARDDRIYGIIVGDGPKMQGMAERIAARGMSDRIKLVGRQSPVEPWIKAMDLFFLSSLTEGLPNVLIEAQSMGVPVATMNAGGARETLAGSDSGILLPEAPPAELAEILHKAVSDDIWREKSGKIAQAFVHENFSLHKVSDAIHQLYDEIDAAISPRP